MYIDDVDNVNGVGCNVKLCGYRKSELGRSGS